MEVSGLGGAGLAIGGGIGGGMGTGAAASTGSLANNPANLDAAAKSAPPPESVADYYAGANSPNPEEIAGQLEGFSIAELLIALMMLASGKQGEDSSGGSSALDFLAGLSFAKTLGSSGSQSACGMPPSNAYAASPMADMGGTLDVSV